MLSSLYKISNKPSLLKQITINPSAKIDVRLFCTHYSNELEWVKLSDDGKVATIGLTEFGQKRLGKVNYVELPQINKKLKEEQKMGSVESANETVFGLYAPVSGEVLEVNSKLKSTPGLINSDPKGNGWMLKFKVSNPNEFKKLMNRSQFDVFVKDYR